VKKYYAFLLLVVLVLAVACGGGGGGNNTPPPPQGTIKAEAVLAGTPSQIVDPKNIQVGETIQFEVVSYSASNVRTVLSSSNWTTTDNGATVGTLSSTGVLTTSASANSIFTATGTAGGKQYSINYEVRPVQAIVTGTVIDSNGNAAPNVRVNFLNSLGTIVASSTTAQNGSLWASVPTSATQFNLDKSTLIVGVYFKSFVYAGHRYTALISTCNAPLPALTNGVTTSLSVITIDAAMTLGQNNAPPPPPDGCS
jgi:hypothetical protein